MVGLGRMGGSMALRLLRGGHQPVAYDVDAAAMARTLERGALPASCLADLVGQMDSPRIVWVMLPPGEVTEDTVGVLRQLLEPGDVVIDGGNSYWKDTMRRAKELAGDGIALLDAGTSGGTWGLQNGYCLMVGGDAQAIAQAEPVFAALATQGQYAHVGASGAGHFVKMVHNGIEYGLLAAYAEGFEIMHESPFDLDLLQVASIWCCGSVVRSWLLELLVNSLERDPDLDQVAGYVDDSGMGRWTVEAAIDEGVPAYSIAAALFSRFASRQDDSFAAKTIAALRNEFGGHPLRRPQERAPRAGKPIP